MAGVIEIEGDAFAQLQAELNAAKPAKALLDKLGSDPAVRKEVLKLVKKVSPQTPIPEIDAAAPFEAEISELRKAIEDEKAARAAEREEAKKAALAEKADKTIASAHRKLRKAGYDDEGIAAVEKLMTDRGIADYEAAMALFERDKKADPDKDIIPVDYGKSWDFFNTVEGADDPLIRQAVSKPKRREQEYALRKWQNREINNTLRELRQGSTVRL